MDKQTMTPSLPPETATCLLCGRNQPPHASCIQCGASLQSVSSLAAPERAKSVYLPPVHQKTTYIPVQPKQRPDNSFLYTVTAILCTGAAIVSVVLMGKAGPLFLGYYLMIGLAVCFGLAVARRFTEGGAIPKLNFSDPYLFAYLRGGKNEALRVATLALIDKGYLLTRAVFPKANQLK